MRCLIPLALAIASVSCSHSPKPAAAVSPGESPIITTIVSRHSTITVRAGVSEPLYSVQVANGETILKDQTINDLQRQNPIWAGQLRSMQADTLYAGIDSGGF